MIVTTHTPMDLEVQRHPVSRSAVGGTEMSGYGQRPTPTRKPQTLLYVRYTPVLEIQLNQGSAAAIPLRCARIGA
jgi:hypothetical protein